MRVLLAVLNRTGTARAVLAAAGLVARRLEHARIEALHVRPTTDPSFVPSEEVMTPARQAHFEAREATLSAELQGIFQTWRDGLEPGADVVWREEWGAQAGVVADAGGKSDLIVIGRALHHAPGNGVAAIMAALFEASAPMLLVPDAVPQSLGARVAVAWKPSETADRAVVAALPLLRRADHVTVLTEGADGAALPADLLRALAERGTTCAVHQLTLAGQSIGAALLGAARLVGADLLVMGAYAHRPSIEALFGGATRDILAHANLPVLMHH